MEAGLAQLKRGGTLVLVGAGMSWPRFDHNRILLNELVITGAFVYDADGFQRALELLASPGFPADALIEPDDVPLDGLLDAVERLVAGELPAKVLVAPARSDGKRRRTMTTPTAQAALQPRGHERPARRCSTRTAGATSCASTTRCSAGRSCRPRPRTAKLVLSAYSYEQFVFLIADDPPMACPRLDHFGMSVETEAELDDMLARAKAFQDARRPRRHHRQGGRRPRDARDHELLRRYLLPMMVEVQWWDFKKADEPA